MISNEKYIKFLERSVTFCILIFQKMQYCRVLCCHTLYHVSTCASKWCYKCVQVVSRPCFYYFFFWWDTYGMRRQVTASIHGKKMKSSIWGAISSRLIWNIWRERNMLNFEGREQLVAQLKSQLLGILFEWQYSESSSVLFYLNMFALWTACIWMD